MKAAVAITLLLAACGGTVRSSGVYRDDTRKVLATRDGQIKSCYEEALAKDPAAKGSVAVKFTVAKKTGAFSRASVDPGKSSAPEALLACVVGAIEGLVLAPADKRDGVATFTYELSPRS
ncbi:MAG: AgmX/PglI C-terminal domain-containing protein [Deltaproteobacteria bacterium]|nr:AgmX/PglI C-terminal domain-containing protein [Deltaproteobacteria bacterium]MCW5807528.1 AgmX/PglI C-terminal domain-containing protein [Deltaproteobacteria bacterium]